MVLSLTSALVLSVAALQQGPQPRAAPAGLFAGREAATGVVEGRVLSEQSGVPVEAAIVEVVGLPDWFAVTDRNGAYRLEAIPAGHRSLRARHLDHLAFELQVAVAPSSTLKLDFELELRPVPITPLTVTQRRITTLGDTIALGGRTLTGSNDDLLASTVEAMGASPGVAELGLAEAIRNVHTAPPDPSDILYVRGATADLKALFLDGAPVYAPAHLGGMTDAFHPGLLANAALHTGGASARYDGGLSYVLDLNTRPGRGGALRTSGAIDMAAARGLVEGSLSRRANVLAGGRVVHGLGTEAWTGDDSPFAYREMVGRVDAAVGATGQVGATLFWNRELVDLERELPGLGGVHWGNLAGSLRFRSDIPGGEANVTTAFGSFRTRLPVGGADLQVIEGQSDRQRILAELAHEWRRAEVEYGLAFDRMRLRHTSVSHAFAGEDDDEPPPPVGTDLQGDMIGIFASANYLLAPYLRVGGGLRANAFLVEDGGGIAPRVSPRLFLGWTVADRAILSLGVGRYYQFVQSRDNFPASDELTFFEHPDTSVTGLAGERPGPRLGVAGATHVVVDLEQVFDYGIRFGIQGFYKSFETVPSIRQPQVQTSGVDIWLRRGGHLLDASVGYSHGWVWAMQDSLLSTSVFAGRHLMDAAFAARLGSRNEIKVRTSYATGLPYTAIPHGGEQGGPVSAFPTFPAAEVPDVSEEPPPTGFPQGTYLRLEGELSRTWRGGGNPGSAYEVTAFLRVLNGVDRRDAMFVRLDESPDGPALASAAPLPVLPILGLRWIF